MPTCQCVLPPDVCLGCLLRKMVDGGGVVVAVMVMVVGVMVMVAVVKVMVVVVIVLVVMVVEIV
jgi:hypothetical protein